MAATLKTSFISKDFFGTVYQAAPEKVREIEHSGGLRAERLELQYSHYANFS